MFINFNKIVLFLAVSIYGLNTFAQELKPDIQSLFIEEQLKEHLNKFNSMTSPANIHINVDAKSYINNFNSNNTKNNKSNNKRTATKNNTVNETNSNHIEIKDNTGSTIASDVTKDKKINSENKESQITASTLAEAVSPTPEVKVIEPVIEVNPAVEPKIEAAIEPAKISVEESFAEAEVVTPAVNEEAVVVTPAITEEEVIVVVPPAEAVVVTPIEMSPEIIIAEPAKAEEEISEVIAVEAAPIAIVAETSDKSRFSIRGFYSFGKFTSISDISTKTALGFALGYDINPSMRIEFQYSFSKYEDKYDYSYSALVSGYNFDQNDFAGILNYKVITDKDFNIYARGGLNYSNRSAYNFYSGHTNRSNSLGAVIGAAADYKVAKNLSLTANLDYTLSLSSSGYSDIASPLYLVENENFLNFSFGLKFDF